MSTCLTVSVILTIFALTCVVPSLDYEFLSINFNIIIIIMFNYFNIITFYSRIYRMYILCVLAWITRCRGMKQELSCCSVCFLLLISTIEKKEIIYIETAMHINDIF